MTTKRILVITWGSEDTYFWDNLQPSRSYPWIKHANTFLDVKVIEVMTSGDEDEEDEGLGAEERTGLVEAVIDVCRLERLSWP